MRPAWHCDDRSRDNRQTLIDWFRGSNGGRLDKAEQEILQRFSQDLFGYYLVYLHNFPQDVGFLHDCPVRNKLVLCARPDAAQCDLCALGERLPLRTDALDAVVLQHTLDFAGDPHQVLREVERVLIPEGRVLVVGFNPWSLWGLWRLFLRWRGRAPWCGHFLSYRRVADWLGLLGFDIEYTDVAAFAPPVRDGWQRKLGLLERVGRRVWPMFAGVYVIRAVKRVSTVTPMRLRWQGLRVLSPSGVVEPSARGRVHFHGDASKGNPDD